MTGKERVRNKSAAILMMMLVILMPFYIADVFALSAQVKSVTIQGSDGIEGTLRQQDTKSVTAEVKYDDDSEVQPDDVVIGSVPFSSCSLDPATSFYECVYQSMVEESNDPTRLSSHTVSVLDESGNVLATNTGRFTVDVTKPSVTQFSASPTLIGAEDEISISFRAEDTSYPVLGTRYCSGIVGVNIYKVQDGEETLIDSYENPDTSSCIFTYDITYAGSQLGGTDATFDLCAEAVDRFEHTSDQNCIEIMLDVTSPGVSGLSVKDASGNPVDYVAAGIEEQLNFYLNVTDDGTGLSVASSSADFSNIVSLAQYSVLAPTECPKNGEVYNCVWKNVPIRVDEGDDTSILFTLVDEAGNEKEETSQSGLVLDLHSPEVSSIRTNISNEQYVFFNKYDNVIIVELLETESGFYDGEFYLDLTPLNGQSKVKADACVEGWTCYFTDIVPNTGVSGEIVINVHPDSRDDAGNPITGTLSQIAYLDDSIPTFGDYIIMNDEGMDENNLKTNDNLYVAIQVSEPFSSPYAYINMSQVSEITEPITGTCYPEYETDIFTDGIEESGETSEGTYVPTYEEELYIGTETASIETDVLDMTSEEWVCEWADLGPLMQGPFVEPITIVAYDSAGNFVEKEINLNVMKKYIAESANWQFEVESQMPEYIDLETTAILNQKQIIDFALEKISDDVNLEAVAIEFLGCQDELGFIESVDDLTGDDITTPSVRLDFALLALDYEAGESLPATCTFAVTARSGLGMFSPELIEVPIEISFFNNPLGELSSSVDDEIKGILEDVSDEKILNTFINLFKVFKSICGIITVITNLSTVITGIGEAFLWLFDVGEFLVKAGSAMNYGMEVTWKYAKYPCGFFTCTLPDLIPGFGEAYNSFVGAIVGSVNLPVTTINRECTSCTKRNPDGTCAPGNCVEYGYEKQTRAFGYGGGIDVDPDTGRPKMNAQRKQAATKWYAGLFSYDPYNDYISAVAGWCIPGILENWQKERAIDCQYVDCLKEQVAYDGFPIEYCKTLREKNRCKFTMGLIPFRQLDQIFSTFTNLLTSWEAVVKLGTLISCEALCYGSGYGCTPCLLLHWYDALRALVYYGANFLQTWSWPDSPCVATLDKYADEYGIDGYASGSGNEEERPEVSVPGEESAEVSTEDTTEDIDISEQAPYQYDTYTEEGVEA